MHMNFAYAKLSRFIRVTTYLVTITAISIVNAAALTSFPTDTEAVVGQMVRLSCSTSERFYVLWEHTAVGASNYEYVYFSGRIIMPYHLRHRIEGNSSAGEYNLVINNVQLSDAGVYGCVDQAGHGERREAQLIVLDSYPICNSSDEVMGENPCDIPEEQVKIRCMIRYSGNRAPVLKCGVRDDSSNNVVANLTETSNNKATYDSALSISWTKKKDPTLVCRTSLLEIASNELHTEALYISKDTSTRHLNHPEQLSCFVKSSQPCLYKWSHKLHDKTTILNGDVIWANKTGLYRCEAECSLRSEQCTAVPLIVHFTETETTSQLQPGQNGTPMFVFILVSLIITLFVIIGIVLFFLLRRMRKQTKAAPTEDQILDMIESDSSSCSDRLMSSIPTELISDSKDQLKIQPAEEQSGEITLSQSVPFDEGYGSYPRRISQTSTTEKMCNQTDENVQPN